MIPVNITGLILKIHICKNDYDGLHATNIQIEWFKLIRICSTFKWPFGINVRSDFNLSNWNWSRISSNCTLFTHRSKDREDRLKIDIHDIENLSKLQIRQASELLCFSSGVIESKSSGLPIWRSFVLTIEIYTVNRNAVNLTDSIDKPSDDRSRRIEASKLHFNWLRGNLSNQCSFSIFKRVILSKVEVLSIVVSLSDSLSDDSANERIDFSIEVLEGLAWSLSFLLNSNGNGGKVRLYF